jgi:putative FmdB family regulatory protein
VPLFEYACRSCKHEFEELVRSAREDQSMTCARCGSREVERRLSVFSARGSRETPATMPRGACGRCGDPDGPCGMG